MRRLLTAASTAALVLAAVPAHAEEPVEDLTPPVIQVTRMAGGVDGWYPGTATVFVRANDPGPVSSGVRSVLWQMTGATTASGSVHRTDGGTLTVTASGVTTIDIEASDANDNTSYGQTQIGIDRDKPTAAFAGRLAAPDRVFARGEQVRVEFSCADALSGVGSCTGTQNAGAWLDTSTIGERTIGVTAVDRVGNTVQLSTDYLVVDNTFVVTRVPEITGTPVVGEVMTAQAPAISPEPTVLAYQWTRDGTAIPGATGATYRLTPDDARTQLRVQATASRSGWETRSVLSDPVQVLPAAITLSSPPALSGVARVGETLLVTHGAVTPTSAVLSYQWLRDGVLIPEVTGRAYMVRADDVGRRISVRVAATAPGHSEAVWVSGVSELVVGRALEVDGVPSVSGALRAGSLLTARPPVVRVPLPSRSGEPAAIAYQWLRDGAPISGAGSATYRLAPADVGRRVTVRVTATRPPEEGYEAVVLTSAAGAPVVAATPVVTARAKAKGDRKVALVVTVTVPGLDPSAAVTVTRGGKVVARGAVAGSGRLVLTLKRQPRGKVTWTVQYAGSRGVAARSVRVSAKVR